MAKLVESNLPGNALLPDKYTGICQEFFSQACLRNASIVKSQQIQALFVYHGRGLRVDL